MQKLKQHEHDYVVRLQFKNARCFYKALQGMSCLSCYATMTIRPDGSGDIQCIESNEAAILRLQLVSVAGSENLPGEAVVVLPLDQLLPQTTTGKRQATPDSQHRLKKAKVKDVLELSVAWKDMQDAKSGKNPCALSLGIRDQQDQTWVPNKLTHARRFDLHTQDENDKGQFILRGIPAAKWDQCIQTVQCFRAASLHIKAEIVPGNKCQMQLGTRGERGQKVFVLSGFPEPECKSKTRKRNLVILPKASKRRKLTKKAGAYQQVFISNSDERPPVGATEHQHFSGRICLLCRLSRISSKLLLDVVLSTGPNRPMILTGALAEGYILQSIICQSKEMNPRHCPVPVDCFMAKTSDFGFVC